MSDGVIYKTLSRPIDRIWRGIETIILSFSYLRIVDMKFLQLIDADNNSGDATRTPKISRFSLNTQWIPPLDQKHNLLRWPKNDLGELFDYLR